MTVVGQLNCGFIYFLAMSVVLGLLSSAGVSNSGVAIILDINQTVLVPFHCLVAHTTPAINPALAALLPVITSVLMGSVKK